MASLADSFLHDLDEEDEEDEAPPAEAPSAAPSAAPREEAEKRVRRMDDDAEEDEEEAENGGDVHASAYAAAPGEDDDADMLGRTEKGAVASMQDLARDAAGDEKATGVTKVAKLRRSPRFQAHMRAVEYALSQPKPQELIGMLESHPEYRLIVASNELIRQIDEEVGSVHKFVADSYSTKFPELENILLNPLEYVRAVQTIGNAVDLSTINLASVLPNDKVLAIRMAASHHTGQPLSEEQLRDVLAGCDEALALDEARAKILQFVESRMMVIAPNVSQLVGTSVAARLLGLAGGLRALSRVPGCNILVMGKDKKHLAGFSRIGVNPHMGIVYDCDVVQNAPERLQRKTAKVVASKVALCARVDSFQQARDGGTGRKFRKDVEEKIEKWLEPPPAKKVKPLPKPDEGPKKHRGGKRFRRMKEKYGMTEVRKHANRLTFGESAGEYGDVAMGLGVGTLYQPGSGRIRLGVKDQKSLLKKQRQHEQRRRAAAANAATGGSGLMSTISFTPTQGMEMVNPEAAAARARAPRQSRYFSGTATFSAESTGKG